MATRALEPIVGEEVHHPALCFEISLSTKPDGAILHSVPDYRRCDVEAVRLALSGTDLTVDVEESDVNTLFLDFIGKIQGTVTSNTPMKRLGCPRFPVWFSKELRGLTIEKKIAHRDFKGSRNFSDLARFRHLRRRCTALSKSCYRNYITHLDSSFSSNPRPLWSYINKLNNTGATPSKIRHNGVEVTEPTDMCNIIAQHFSSVFSPPSPCGLTFTSNLPNLSISSCSIDQEDVVKQLKSLDELKGCGPDGIPPSVLKHCADLLASPLTVLFNKSLRDGLFPDILKNGFIVPIPKSGDASEVTNLRPVVVLSSLSKVFERLVLNQLSSLFKNVIAEEQHGFVSGRSTATNLLVLQNHILQAFERGNQVDVIYLDYAKAFDKINHATLLYKMKNYGVLGQLLNWFGSYLADRNLRVKFASALSSPITATSGVPQGSLLGPFLFLLFVNDLPGSLKVRSFMFADDIKLILEVKTVRDCLKLQNALNFVLDWSRANKMFLNPSKCKVMSFCRNLQPINFQYILDSTRLDRVQTFRDLGVVLSSDLSPESHIDEICRKANRALGLLFRLSRDPFSIQTLLRFYCCFVRQQLEYCSTTWSPHLLGQCDRLESIQRRFIRLVGMRKGFRFLDAPVSDIQVELGLLPLKIRREVADVCFLHKLLTGVFDCRELLERVEFRIPMQTRSRDLFYRRAYHRNYLHHAAFPRMMNLGNLVARRMDFFVGLSPAAFKKRVITVLQHQ